MAGLKLRQILTCGRADHSNSDAKPKDEPHTDTRNDEDDDSYNTLSEVAAPCPVERVADDERARRNSLESHMMQTHSQPHVSKNEREG